MTAPPYDEHAEKDAVASLAWASEFWHLAKHLRPEHFYLAPCREAFETMAKLNAEGAFWGKQDFFATLIEGYFSPGSVWENEAGERFVVRGNEDLQAAPPPEGDERWRPQRLEAR